MIRTLFVAIGLFVVHGTLSANDPTAPPRPAKEKLKELRKEIVEAWKKAGAEGPSGGEIQT